jgi:RND family efflux transporter MFP subunit
MTEDGQASLLESPDRSSPERGTPDPDKPKISTSKGGLSRARLFGRAVLLLLAGALALGVWSHYEQYRQATIAAQQHRDFVPSVRVGTLKESDQVIHATWPGTILAYEQANIFARATGYISTRNVDIGSQVRTGDVLAIIAAPDLDQQYEQAKAQLVQLQAAVEQAQANADLGRVTNGRTSRLVATGVSSAQQGDQDRLTFASETAALAVARANVVVQQAVVNRLVQVTGFEQVTAPFGGMVTGRFIDVGDLVQGDTTGGTSMFTMMHSNVIRIQTYVPQDQAFGLTVGGDAIIRVPEMPKRNFPGKVTMIAGALAPGTRTLLTEIDVPNPDGALTPGTYCAVELRIPRRTPSFIVPADAVIFNQDGLHVAVVENGIVHMHMITIARDFGREVEVSDGVKNDDKVILNPPVDLQEGSKVQTRAVPPDATP